MTHRFAFGTAALATLAAIVLLFMTGCANPNLSQAEQDQLRIRQTWVAGCSSYSAALKSLWGYYQEGKLSEHDVGTIQYWRGIINPICQADNPPAGQGALDLIDNALTQLLLLERDKA